MSELTAASRKFQKELNAGTTALVLLSLLSGSRKPMYGYQIAKLIDHDSTSSATMKQGAFYPVLRSLEANGLLASSVEPSVSGPPRRYYRITPEGRATLREWRRIWSETRRFVEATLQEQSDD
jgi:PadR family transcriptional regulator, regulatory protein PadR